MSDSLIVVFGLVALAIYVAPSIVGWRRRSPNLGPLILVNLFFGWSVIGWFLCWILAFWTRPLFSKTREALREVATSPAYPSAPASSGAPSWASTPETPRMCGACGGSGTQYCTMCAGRGTWWEAPTTATGTAEARHCAYCTSSGKLQCSSCGGSGKVRF